MAIIREFRCADCGSTFESSAPVEEVMCPHCSGAEPERVFLTPPGIKSPQTSIADREIRGLAADYGLSDVSNKDGAPVKKVTPPEQAPQFTGATPQVTSVLQRLGSNADGFSSVLPALRNAGRPHQWNKTRERR